jgi:cytochrome c biogenesis protein CcmG, thiol:disulfide interchange protein DsbE
MRAKHLMLLLPLVGFFSIVGFLLSGLFSEPRYQVATSVGKPLPAFELPLLMQPDKTVSQKDLTGEPFLLNVWGTWCVTCAVELPYLTRLSQQGVKIVGLYYEQDIDPDFGGKSIQTIQQEVNSMLDRLGNPYAFNVWDVKRDYSMDLGVTGAPETFLVDKTGRVLVHHIGDVNPMVWQQKLRPAYEKAKNG